ncbi:MAG: 3D domain-containing protein, partial [Armatimonadota bacterium]
PVRLGSGSRPGCPPRGAWAAIVATHWWPPPPAARHGRGVDGTTAIGLRAGYGVVAVDPQIIPLRSILYIEGYGQAIAGDTGGAIKGHRIDLGFSTAREAYKFGRRPVRVYILSTPQRSRPRR